MSLNGRMMLIINMEDFIDKMSEDIADQEYDYSLCDPDWDNLQRAAEKGIKAGIEWYKNKLKK